MFLFLGGPLGIFLVLIWVLLEEKSERDQERWERQNPVFRKLPSHIPPLKPDRAIHDFSDPRPQRTATQFQTLKSRSKKSK